MGWDGSSNRSVSKDVKLSKGVKWSKTCQNVLKTSNCHKVKQLNWGDYTKFPKLPQDYPEITLRFSKLPWDYPKISQATPMITSRLPWGYTEIILRFSKLPQDYSKIASGLPWD